MTPSVAVSGLGFAWPDGGDVFDGLDLAAGTGRTGLVGANGSGKSTLLVLVLDAVRPRFGPEMTLNVRGPERVALLGPNGAGKTTLLRTITGELPPAAGEVRLAVPARLLPQRLDVLDPRADRGGQRRPVRAARLAQRRSRQPGAMLFPGRRADQPVATLSGGELFRATLAALLLAEIDPL